MKHNEAHEEKQNKALRALAHELEGLGARGVCVRVEEILGADEAAPVEDVPAASVVEEHHAKHVEHPHAEHHVKHESVPVRKSHRP